MDRIAPHALSKFGSRRRSCRFGIAQFPRRRSNASVRHTKYLHPTGAAGRRRDATVSEIDRSSLPIRRAPFDGTVNRTLEGSEPDWDLIGHPEPPAGAPNVLLVLIDDAGFGNPSTFGGPIQTPNYTRLAEGGLRYNRFHVTALCSPTRAALLTGRNNHAVGLRLDRRVRRRLSPATRRSCPATARRCHGSCATTATAPRRSASGI